MLVELHIENFAIIDRLNLTFTAGLITFTGETGAGKSIIIDALNALLGGRVDPNLIRSGSERSNVEGIFRVPGESKEGVHQILQKEDLLDDPEWITIGREIRSNGRSIARINGRSVSASLLKELGDYLVDIHGQSDHLSLLHVNRHLGLLDRYIFSLESRSQSTQPSLQKSITAYQKTYRQLQKVAQEIENLSQSERDTARRSDMLSFQINEIENSRLKVGEEEALKDERNRLSNAEGLASLAQEALVTLDDGTPESPAITDLIGQVVHALAGLSRIDTTQLARFEEIQAISDNLSELASSLRSYEEGIEFNPRRLDQVEERLALIQTLKRKYGDNIQAVINFGTHAQEELDRLTHSAERISELEVEQEELLLQLNKEGQVLSEIRHAAAIKLSNSIEVELADLNMAGARFMVAFLQQPEEKENKLISKNHSAYSISGLDKIEFMIAPNPGEGFKPLVKIASGGETSRLMLAMKNVLAKADEIPTLVFDEIDQGIGGRVGSIVGEKLWTLGRHHQVLCITHLPQLAAFGEQHFCVQKAIEEGRTTTQVKPLEGQDRLVELAQMMGDVSEGTLRSAREILLMVQKRTNGVTATKSIPHA